MNIRALISREIEAIKRDREYDKAHTGAVGHTLEEFMQHMEQYPSIMTRFKELRGSVRRAKSKVTEFPYVVKNFIHRGRHGWATPDTWSMDYTLAKQLDGVFREFARVSCAYPVDQDPDEWNKMILEIADGFREYWQFQDRDWSNDFPGDDLKEAIEHRDKEFVAAYEKLQNSLDLMKAHWPHFWW